MPDIDPAIQHVFDTYSSSVYAKDEAAFLALYDADVHVFDMWGQWEYRGLEAWRGMVSNWFGGVGEVRVVAEFAQIEVSVHGDFALAHAILTFKGVGPDGTELRQMNNRMTLALQRKDAVWKIIHEHTSAPADFETGKLILNRQVG